MNKYLEKIAELNKEAMNPAAVIAAAKKKGLDVGKLRNKMLRKADAHMDSAKGLRGSERRKPFAKAEKVVDNSRKLGETTAAPRRRPSLIPSIF